jgi:hypothetical protein
MYILIQRKNFIGSSTRPTNSALDEQHIYFLPLRLRTTANPSWRTGTHNVAIWNIKEQYDGLNKILDDIV